MKKKENRFERAALILLLLLFFVPKGSAKADEVEKENDKDDETFPPKDNDPRLENDLPIVGDYELEEPEEEKSSDCDVRIDPEAFERSFDHNIVSGGGGSDWLFTERNGGRREVPVEFKLARS